jgi:YD repeat-containing protein
MNNSTNTGSTTGFVYREAKATEKSAVSGATEATEVTNARGKTTTYNLNGLSRCATDPLGHRRDNTYDAFDNVTNDTTESASTVNGYTADGLNLTSVALPGMVATTLAYNAPNQPVRAVVDHEFAGQHDHAEL